MKKYVVVILLLALCSSATANTATAPANLSLNGIIQWAIAAGWIGSGTGALPTVASAGVWYLDLSNATAPVPYRSDGGSWQPMSAGAGGADASTSASLTAHIATYQDPHGATMTVTQWMQIGSGTPDCSVERSGTGTVTISSYTRIVPETATPTGDIATGTMWYDSNTGYLRCYDGSAWHNLW